MLRMRTNNVCECFSQSSGQFYISNNPWFFNQNLSALLYRHSRARLCVKSSFHDFYVSSSRVWEATPQMVFTVFKYIHPPSPNFYIKWSSRTPFSASILPMTLGFMRFWASLIKVPFLLEWKASNTIVSHLCNLSGVLFKHYNKRETKESVHMPPNSTRITDKNKGKKRTTERVLQEKLTYIGCRNLSLPVHHQERMHLSSQKSFLVDLLLQEDGVLFALPLALIWTCCPLPHCTNGT